jgi:hypothetical protein
MNIHIKATQIAANGFRARFPLCRKHKTTNFLFPETQTRRTTMKLTTRATTTTCSAGEGGLMGTRVWSGLVRSGLAGVLSRKFGIMQTRIRLRTRRGRRRLAPGVLDKLDRHWVPWRPVAEQHSVSSATKRSRIPAAGWE